MKLRLQTLTFGERHFACRAASPARDERIEMKFTTLATEPRKHKQFCRDRFVSDRDHVRRDRFRPMPTRIPSRRFHGQQSCIEGPSKTQVVTKYRVDIFLVTQLIQKKLCRASHVHNVLICKDEDATVEL